MEETHVWSERLDLGNDTLDSEHHLQIALVSALAEAIEQGRPWMARRLVEQLAGYSAAHFTGEEVLMESAGYRPLDDHRQEHRAILGHIDEIRSLLTTAENELAQAMALDLLAGLGSHIAASDRRFTEQSRVREPGH
ncbi:MAG TPA: hemerythrin family protein [Anaeromyxobacteraceae bacterium]